MSVYLGIRKYGRLILLAAIIMAAGGGGLWFTHVQGNRPAPPPLPDSPMIESKAQMVTRDFRHEETRLDRTVWILEAG